MASSNATPQGATIFELNNGKKALSIRKILNTHQMYPQAKRYQPSASVP
jgi:hypothetical protein